MGAFTERLQIKILWWALSGKHSSQYSCEWAVGKILSAIFNILTPLQKHGNYNVSGDNADNSGSLKEEEAFVFFLNYCYYYFTRHVCRASLFIKHHSDTTVQSTSQRNWNIVKMRHVIIIAGFCRTLAACLSLFKTVYEGLSLQKIHTPHTHWQSLICLTAVLGCWVKFFMQSERWDVHYRRGT